MAAFSVDLPRDGGTSREATPAPDPIYETITITLSTLGSENAGEGLLLRNKRGFSFSPVFRPFLRLVSMFLVGRRVSRGEPTPDPDPINPNSNPNPNLIYS